MKHILVIVGLLIVPACFAQKLTTSEYKKALWMTTRMYGGQRSGDGPNWLVMNHTVTNNGVTRNGKDFVGDADGDHSLSGGWHDCGDHVKFGQTEFYSAYALLVAYDAFPEGYDDYYSWDYKAYAAASDFTWEGNKHDPNGIPDILDEVKYATDFFIKCAKDNNTFYYQVGNGNYDHKNWVTSVYMATLPTASGGEPRPIGKNPADAAMASFCGASLAVMSRVYKDFDPDYAQKCLTHALFAYAYAKAHPGCVGAMEGAFYGADKAWEDNFICLCTELYYATGDAAYRTEALGYSSKIKDHNWVLDYQNNNDLAAYNLARLGDAYGTTLLNTFCTAYKAKVNANTGLIEVGSTWGPLRYSCNATLVIALQDALEKNTTIDPALSGTIDYVLGKNSANQSFVVGFGSKYPTQPHHRNVFANDGNNMKTVKIPERNKQHGYLVGGVRNPGSYSDLISDYSSTEGGCDYNAGLVGALGYINSRLAPVDISKFKKYKCSSPQLGADASLCGVQQIVLNTNLTAEKRSFTWKRNDVVIPGSTPSISITQEGTYSVTVDSAGCISTDQVLVSASLPTPNLGPDMAFPGSNIVIDAGFSGDGISFKWNKNGQELPDQTSRSLSVETCGDTYSVTASASGCPSTSDQITINCDQAPYGVNPTPIPGRVEAENYDIQYVAGAAWSDADAANSGNVYRTDGVDIQANTDGGANYNIGWTAANEFLEYTISSAETAEYSLEIRVAAQAAGGILQLKINDSNLGNSISVPATGGWQTWQTIKTDGVSIPGGTHVLRVSILSGGFNLNYIDFVKKTDDVASQVFHLDKGWSLFSTNIRLSDSSITSVFKDINIEEVKTFDKFWAKNQGESFNSLKTITPGEGYLVKTNSPSTLTITGTQINENPKYTSTGWNLVGCPFNTPKPLSSFFNTANCLLVKNFDGFWKPDGTTNSIQEMNPGKAYYVHIK